MDTIIVSPDKAKVEITPKPIQPPKTNPPTAFFVRGLKNRRILLISQIAEIDAQLAEVKKQGGDVSAVIK